MEFDINTGEEIVDTWPLIYFAWRGCRYEGKCTITKNHFCYDVKSVHGFADVDKHTMQKLKMIINRNSIHQVSVWRKFFQKRISITMCDGEEHVFSYRDIKTKRIVAALVVRKSAAG